MAAKIVMLFLVGMLYQTNAQRCAGANQVYNDVYGPGCPQTCDTFNVQCNSFAAGPPGCYCIEGYVRDNNNNCVAGKTYCAEPVAEKPVCNKFNEQYNEFGTCDGTCDNQQPFCIQSVNPGCYCKKNYFRDENGRCVSKVQCELTEKFNKLKKLFEKYSG